MPIIVGPGPEIPPLLPVENTLWMQDGRMIYSVDGRFVAKASNSKLAKRLVRDHNASISGSA